ncbi:hypothetical protein [Streptomyces variabilis]
MARKRKNKTVAVSFSITETVTTDVEAEVTVPSWIADDWERLLDWLEANESAWIDEIDPAAACVEERDITEILDVEDTDAEDETD